MGVNGIKQATPACFFTVFGEIFLEYFWYILKNLRKNLLKFI